MKHDEKLSRQKDDNIYEKGGWYSVPQLLKSQTALALWGGRFCSSESSWPFTLSQSKHHFLPNRLISKSYNEHKFVSHSSTWQQRMLFWRQYLLLLWQLCDLQMTNKTTIINCELGDKQQIISRLTPILTNKSNAQIHAGSPHTWQAQRHSFERFRWMNMRTWNCHHDRLLSSPSDLEHMPKGKKNTPRRGQGWNTLERSPCVLITVKMIENISWQLRSVFMR